MLPQELIVDYRPPKRFTGRLVLEEAQNTVTVYLAPKQTIGTYTGGKKYAVQKIAERAIEIEGDAYILTVDGVSEKIETGRGGRWGSFTELYRRNGKIKALDAVIITVGTPYSFTGMEKMARYFFKELQPIQEKRKDGPAR